MFASSLVLMKCGIYSKLILIIFFHHLLRSLASFALKSLSHFVDVNYFIFLFLGFYADQEARCQVFRVCTNTDLSGRGSMILLFIHVFHFQSVLTLQLLVAIVDVDVVAKERQTTKSD